MARKIDREQRERLTTARAQLILREPFYGTLALKLKLVECDAVMLRNEIKPLPTMATDSVHLFYNRDFVRRTSDEELVGCVCHEVLHCVMLHSVRMGDRDNEKWNHACDYAVNLIVEDDSGFELPSFRLKDPQYKGMPAEEIYGLLPNPPSSGKGKGQKDEGEGESQEGEGDSGDQDGKGKGNGKGKSKAKSKGNSGNGNSDLPGGVGDVLPAPRDQEQELEHEWKTSVAQAARVAKSQGTLPASMEQYVEDLMQPKMDWKALLRQFIQMCSDRTDYTWRSPNSRFLAHGAYLPRLHGEQTPPIVVAIDTSGSIGTEIFAQFVSELKSIIEDCRPACTYTLYCDAAVAGVDEWPQGEFDAKQAGHRRGGGGTRFEPVFEWIEEQGLDPACLIYLTDTYGSFPEEPSYPVIWAKSCNGQVPWGLEVELELE